MQKLPIRVAILDAQIPAMLKQWEVGVLTRAHRRLEEGENPVFQDLTNTSNLHPSARRKLSEATDRITREYEIIKEFDPYEDHEHGWVDYSSQLTDKESEINANDTRFSNNCAEYPTPVCMKNNSQIAYPGTEIFSEFASLSLTPQE